MKKFLLLVVAGLLVLVGCGNSQSKGGNSLSKDSVITRTFKIDRDVDEVDVVGKQEITVTVSYQGKKYKKVSIKLATHVSDEFKAEIKKMIDAEDDKEGAKQALIEGYEGEGGIDELRDYDGITVTSDWTGEAMVSEIEIDPDKVDFEDVYKRQSIASVSVLTILTAQEGASHGTKLEAKGGEITSLEPATSPVGTKITVEDLFFNTPARLKYMKSQQAELSHIVDILNRLSLAHPEIAFTLILSLIHIWTYEKSV